MDFKSQRFGEPRPGNKAVAAVKKATARDRRFHPIAGIFESQASKKTREVPFRQCNVVPLTVRMWPRWLAHRRQWHSMAAESSAMSAYASSIEVRTVVGLACEKKAHPISKCGTFHWESKLTRSQPLQL